MTMNNTPGLKTLEKGFKIIDLIADAKRPLTASEIAEVGDIPVSTAYKFLACAVSSGYLDFQKSDKTYNLGVKFLKYASIVRESRSIISLAYPLMTELAEKSKETVHLGIPQGYYGIFLEKVISCHVLGVQTKIGSGSPFNKGATQKAMMAFISEERFSDFCKNYVLKEDGEIGVKKAIEDRAKIRVFGYAVSYAEVNDNVAAIAAPVFGYKHELVGSLAIALPIERNSEEKEKEFIGYIKEYSRRLSVLLGDI